MRNIIRFRKISLLRIGLKNKFFRSGNYCFYNGKFIYKDLSSSYKESANLNSEMIHTWIIKKSRLEVERLTATILGQKKRTYVSALSNDELQFITE